MNKRILEVQTTLCQKMPAWLVAILTPVMVQVLFTVGSILFFTALTFLAVTYFTMTGTLDKVAGGIAIPLHLQLLSFGMVALLLFIWVKWVERRPISSLGFFSKNWLKELGLGFLVGSA